MTSLPAYRATNIYMESASVSRSTYALQPPASHPNFITYDGIELPLSRQSNSNSVVTDIPLRSCWSQEHPTCRDGPGASIQPWRQSGDTLGSPSTQYLSVAFISTILPWHIPGCSIHAIPSCQGSSRVSAHSCCPSYVKNGSAAGRRARRSEGSRMSWSRVCAFSY